MALGAGSNRVPRAVVPEPGPSDPLRNRPHVNRADQAIVRHVCGPLHTEDYAHLGLQPTNMESGISTRYGRPTVHIVGPKD